MAKMTQREPTPHTMLIQSIYLGWINDANQPLNQTIINDLALFLEYIGLLSSTNIVAILKCYYIKKVYNSDWSLLNMRVLKCDGTGEGGENLSSSIMILTLKNMYGT